MSNENEPHHRIHQYDIRIVQGSLEIRGSTYEYAEFTARGALSLLAWLRQEEATLQTLAKEQE